MTSNQGAPVGARAILSNAIPSCRGRGSNKQNNDWNYLNCRSHRTTRDLHVATMSKCTQDRIDRWAHHLHIHRYSRVLRHGVAIVYRTMHEWYGLYCICMHIHIINGKHTINLLCLDLSPWNIKPHALRRLMPYIRRQEHTASRSTRARLNTAHTLHNTIGCHSYARKFSTNPVWILWNRIDCIEWAQSKFAHHRLARYHNF